MPMAETSLGLRAGRSHGPDAVRLACVAGVGLAAGAVTQWSVLHLSFDLRPLCNTAAPWVLLATLMALSARRMSEAVLLACVSLITLVAGFYLAQSTRGWAVSQQQVLFWSATSLVAGPLLGLAAGWLRHGGPTAAALGAGVLGGILVGEAAHGLRDLRFVSAPGYWDVQLAIGVSLAIGLALWRSRGDRRGAAAALAVTLAACAVSGLGTLLAYQVT